MKSSMGRASSTLTLLLSVVVTSGANTEAKPGLPAWPVPPDMRALVRIDALECPSRPRRGSGFVWSSVSSVVTAFHVVAGCDKVMVYYPTGGGQMRSASIAKVLRSADLALLSVESPVGVTPLAVTSSPPQAGADMTAWGYPVAVDGLLDTRPSRRSAAGKLKDLLNPHVRKEVMAVGMPNLESSVLFLEGGHLLPGHSGAPLIDASGNVAGIANGGLEQGAVEISWAIPAGELTRLLSSTESADVAAGGSDALFSAEWVEEADLGQFAYDVTQSPPAITDVEALGETFACGEGSFTKVRSRTFSDIAATADDQIGLNQLVAISGHLLKPTDEFDIYQDLRTGATVVVPGGSELRESGGRCVADVLGQKLQQVISVAAAADPGQAQAASVRYEQDLVEHLGGGQWQSDPAWTYLAPVTRPDGGIIRRKGSVQVQQFGMGWVPVRYAFESLAVKGGFFLGVTGFRHDMSLQRLQMQGPCLAGSQMPGCSELLEELRRLAQMNVATHLSSFPIS